MSQDVSLTLLHIPIWLLHVFTSPKRGQTEHSVYHPDSCISMLTIRSDLFHPKTCTGRCQVLISLKRPIRQVAWAIGNTLNDVSQLARPLFSKSQRTFQNEITSSSFPQNFQIVFYSNFSHENISLFFSKVLLCVLIVYYLPNFHFYRSIANLVYFIYHRKII